MSPINLHLGAAPVAALHQLPDDDPLPVTQALLEKNEDLSKQNEKIAEEFSQKLEVGPV
jgi:hypothetical protein